MRLTSRNSLVRKNNISLIASTIQNSKVAEQYRMIRTNFLSSNDCQHSRSILFSSPNRSEGKSTTVANFAITLAQQGKKVLLIDADFRNSILHFAFNVDNYIGLSSYLNRRTVLENSIKNTTISGLDLLPSGPVPFNPSEIIGTDLMESLINTVKETYDVVLIDSPPILEFADAKIIANQCDGIILVLRSGKTQREKAIEAKKYFETSNAKLLGIIMNEK